MFMPEIAVCMPASPNMPQSQEDNLRFVRAWLFRVLVAAAGELYFQSFSNSATSTATSGKASGQARSPARKTLVAV